MGHNVLICDDHSIVRLGIKSVIKNTLVVNYVDEASCEQEIISNIKSQYYDLIILDINIPGVDFASMMEWLKVTAPKSPILVFSTHTEDIYGRRSFQLGAKGFLPKTASNNEVAAAIKKIVEGGIYISEILEQMLSSPQELISAQTPFDKLSSRELEIALLINKGQSLPEICSTLNIQYSTANTYKRRIFEKLNVYNSLALSRLMMSFKIV